MTIAHSRPSANWAFWGVAEFWDDSLHLVNFGPRPWEVVRTHINSGQTEIIASFEQIRPVSFTVSPRLNRWYLTYSESGDFGGLD